MAETKITRAMIEAGAIAFAEWSSPNYGKKNWGKSPEFDDAKRRIAEVILKAALETLNG